MSTPASLSLSKAAAPSSLEITLSNEHDTQALAQALAATNPAGSLWLVGDLGAGKTTFSRYLLQALGHHGSVKSPTYTLVEPYRIADKPVYHADLYRLNDPEELDFIGFFEYFDEPDALVIIEWPSKAETLLPAADMCISISKQHDVRQANIHANKVLIDALQAQLHQPHQAQSQQV